MLLGEKLDNFHVWNLSWFKYRTTCLLINQFDWITYNCLIKIISINNVNQVLVPLIWLTEIQKFKSNCLCLLQNSVNKDVFLSAVKLQKSECICCRISLRHFLKLTANVTFKNSFKKTFSKPKRRKKFLLIVLSNLFVQKLAKQLQTLQKRFLFNSHLSQSISPSIHDLFNHLKACKCQYFQQWWW